MLVRPEAKVLDGITRVLGAAEQEGVGAGGLLERELVEGERLSSRGEDAGAGRRGEAEGGHVQDGQLEQAVVVRDGADDHHGPLVVLGQVGGDARERDRRPVLSWVSDSAPDALNICVEPPRTRLTMRLMKRRRSTTLLKLLSVRPVRKELVTGFFDQSRRLSHEPQEATYEQGSGTASREA